MAADQTLKILVKTEGDTSGLDQVNTKLKDIGTTATQTSQAAEALGNLIGIGLGAGAVGSAIALANAITLIGEKQQAFAEEILKSTQNLNNQETAWFTLAANASSFFEVVRLGMQMLPEVQRLEAELNKTVQTQLTTWEKIYDYIVRIASVPAGFGAMATTGPAAAEHAAEVKAKQDELSRALVDSVSAFNRAKDASDEWAAIQAGPVSDGIEKVTANIEKLKAQIATLKPTESPIDNKQFFELNTNLATQEKHLQVLNDLQDRQAEGFAEGATKGRDYVEVLRQAETIIQGIHQQQQLIQQAPFMGADERSAALLRSYVAEMQKLQQIMVALRTQQAGGGLDPAQLEQVNQRLQQAGFQLDLLRQKTLALQAPLRTELTNWANSFGSTMTQLGHTIEQTVGVALQGLNQWLVTGKFNAQAMLQQIEMLGLQLIEQLIIQRVMAAINASAAAGQAAVTGPAIAAAFAPAATAVTIATEGGAAAAAPAEYAAALLAIQAMAVAHTGGRIGSLRKRHSGGLGSDEELVVAQQGEVMIQRDVAQRPGMTDFLLGLNAGAFHKGGLIRRMHRGGEMGSWEDYMNAVLDFSGGTFEPNLPEGWRNTGWTPPDPLDQNVGPQVITPTDRSERLAQTMQDIQERSYDFGSGLGRFANYSFNPPSWTPGFMQGPTMIPSQFDFAGYPIAQAVGAWTPTVSQQRLSLMYPSIEPKHRGGMIGRAGSAGGSLRSGNVHVHNYTDLKALVKEMATRKGRNIIVDTVRGQRIDLGMR